LGRGDSPPREAGPEPLSSPRQPALDRPDRTTQLPGRLLGRQALQIAQHHGRPAAPRQPIDLVVEDISQIVTVLLAHTNAYQFGRPPLVPAPAGRGGVEACGDAVRHPMEPGSQ
jgi:hypothetical protein